MDSSTIYTYIFIIFTSNIFIITAIHILIYIYFIYNDRYWRKINDVRNDIENSVQISSTLLRLKEYDEKLDNLSKIGNNENNISSNLGKIGNNESNISSNLGKIDTNESNIFLI